MKSNLVGMFVGKLSEKVTFTRVQELHLTLDSNNSDSSVGRPFSEGSDSCDSSDSINSNDSSDLTI